MKITERTALVAVSIALATLAALGVLFLILKPGFQDIMNNLSF